MIPEPTDPIPDPINPEPEDDEDDIDVPEVNTHWLMKIVKMIVQVLFNLFKTNKD